MKAGIVFGLLSVGLFGASTTLAMLLVDAIDSWMPACSTAGPVRASPPSICPGPALRQLAVEAPLCRTDVPWLALVILAGGVLPLNPA